VAAIHPATPAAGCGEARLRRRKMVLRVCVFSLPGAVEKNRRCASGSRVYLWVAGPKPNLEDGARNLIDDRHRALP
jgi:hypothetical protein